MYSNKNLKYKIGLILLVAGLSAYLAFPLSKKINLGLDLRGGMHLVLQVDTSKLAKDAKNDAVERAIEIIRNRIDEFGVSEPQILRQGENQIVVQLPGVTDRARAKDLIGRTALLEFKLVNDNAEALSSAAKGEVPADFIYTKDEDARPVLLSESAPLTGETIKDALVTTDQYGLPAVKLEFDAKGTEIFAKLTADHINERLAIVLDGKIHSAPVIRSKIDAGVAEITRGGGGFSPEEAGDLRIILRSGALPAPMNVEEERTIGPLLGADSIRTGVKASIIGTALVFVFIIFYYLFSGIIASFALLLNFLIILGSLGMFHATLTLPGIAGIVLTLGMAVDANVLINERIREELKLGKTLFSAVKSGYEKAFNAIFDSNLTTLIAAFFLFQFGTGPIRGFALTLTIGLIASMFTAIFVTRTVFEICLLNRNFKTIKMRELIGQTKFDFIGKRKIFYVISLVVITIGLFSFFSKGKDGYGIDFSGGQIQEYKFARAITLEQARALTKEAKITDASIQQFKEDSTVVIIRTPEDTAEIITKKFTETFKDNKFEILRIEKVGPIAGRELQKKAILALVLSLLGILIYVVFRFKHFEFGAAGVIALFHDILIALGFLALSGKQIDLLIVTAFLTIAGYSINDTIVIYDRVRENMRIHNRLTLAQIINLSVNQMLSRTILTSGVTLFVVIALFFWGGEVLHSFAYALLVGFISGVYSTVYIASPLVLAWSRKKIAHNG